MTTQDANAPVLSGRRIVLGVSASIAAYKAADLASRLVHLGADVHAVLTPNASQMVGPATFRALTRNPVLQGVFDEPHERQIAHIELAQSADIILVAPATANVLAKMAHGIADDMLTTLVLAATAPVIVAPAMNTAMWLHAATQTNVATLAMRGVRFVEPGDGPLACGTVGPGRLADVDAIVGAVLDVVSPRRDLAGRDVLVTAGPTREPLDPVRYLTNRSSGRMGYAVAEAAAMRGARVTLVTGPTALAVPCGVDAVRVTTTQEMLEACVEAFARCDAAIAAAAPADFAPTRREPHKIKKSGGEGLRLDFVQTPDIVATLAASKGQRVVVGFAAETTMVAEHAAAKLAGKGLDLIIANDVSAPGSGFEVDTNIVTLIWPDGRSEALPRMPKREVADRIIDALAPLLH